MKTSTHKSNLLVKVMVMLMAVLVLSTAFAPMKALANSTYMLTVTLNEADSRYEPIIVYDRAGWGQNHAAHRETKLGYFGEYKYGSVPLPDMSKSTPAKVESALEKYNDKKYVRTGVTAGAGNAHLIFSFPGYHGEHDYDATAKDLARAEWVSATMVQSLNDAISFVTTTTKKQPNKYEFMYLGTKIANGGYHKTGDASKPFTYNGYSIKVTAQASLPSTERKVDGVNSDGYAKITISKDGERVGSARYFVSKVPKGYKENQLLFPSLPKKLQDLKDDKQAHGFSEDVTSLTWKHAVLQAHYSFGENGITYDKFDEILKPNKVEQLFTEMGEGFLLMLRTMLGLQSFSDLMLNEGLRGGGGYFLGIMPTAWLNSASILHWTSMVLSWLLMMFAFVKVLALRNLAAINIAKRVDMVDGIKNLIVVGFALMLFNPIFYALANFNWLLVDVFKNTSNVTSSFGTTAPGAGLLAKLFINFAYFIMEIYFNFIYISRGIIVAILYGVGPLFVASLAFGGKYAQIFSNYVRELVGTIYMQTFHAILVAFFASVTVFGGVRLFEQLVVLFAFIPLTKFFREAIGVGGGLADIAGAGAFGAVGDMTKMGTKGMRQSSGKAASSFKNSKASGNSAPMTQTKSASNFNGGSGSGSGGGSMSKVDNDYGSPTVNLTEDGKYTNDSGSEVKFNAMGNVKGSSGGGSGAGRSSNAGFAQSKSGGGMTSVDGSDTPNLQAQLVGNAFKASSSFVGMGGAVGMSAVGAGGVAQNMQQVKPKAEHKRATTGKQAQSNRNQKAPQQVFDNSGYDSSEISDSQNNVNHKFRQREEDGSSGMYDDYGITDVREEKGNLVYEYDYNSDSNSFNAGSYSDGQQAMKMQDMNKVFNSEHLSPEQEARKAQYTSQGIQSVSQNANGRMEIHAKKGTGGIQGVGTGNGMYHFQKRNGDNGSINMLDAIEFADMENNSNSSK